MIHFIQFTHSLYDKCDQFDSDDEQSGTTNNYNAFLAAVWIELHCFVSTGFVPWEGMEGGMGGGWGIRRMVKKSSCRFLFPTPGAQLRGDDDWAADVLRSGKLMRM